MSGNSDQVALAKTKKAMPRISTTCNARVCVMKRTPIRMALRKRSAGNALAWCSRRHRNSTAMMPKYDNAFSRKTNHGPIAATRTPAIAGPMARDTLMAMLFNATAEDSSLGGNELRHDGGPRRHHQ